MTRSRTGTANRLLSLSAPYGLHLRAAVRRRLPRRTRTGSQEPADTFDSYVAAVMRAHRPANVAVVAGPESPDLGRVLDALGPTTVRVFSSRALPAWHLRRRGIKLVTTKHIGLVSWHFKRFGPFDAIVNCAGAGKDGQFYAFRRLFFHLRAGGVYVQDRSVVPPDQWAKVVRELRQLPPLGADDQDPGTPAAELADAVGEVSANRVALMITKRTDHWLKLHPGEADRFLRTRDVPITSRIITTRPESTFESRADLHLHVSKTEPTGFPAGFECPQLYLHAYSGDLTMTSHALLYGDSTILPESFRYQNVTVLGNTKLIDPSYSEEPGMAPAWSADFARVPDELQPERTLSGDYFHLDCPYPGHFGHMMTDVISRLWGWQQAKQEIPGLKAIIQVHRDDTRPELATTLFRAYGIAEEDITWVGEPVRLRSVVGATSMWQNKDPHYVHPDILQTWQRLRDGLIVDGGATPEKIFVSRPAGSRRSCRNSGEVERYFADRGYEIVYPETMDLSQQATIFAGARVVAGFGGSAMFNLLFARRVEKLIVLTHDSYTARNEYLFASVLGCQTHYVWSDPDIWQPEDHLTQAAFQSPWEFDFERNRSILDEIS